MLLFPPSSLLCPSPPQGLNDGVDRESLLRDLVSAGQEGLAERWLMGLGKEDQVRLLAPC